MTESVNETVPAGNEKPKRPLKFRWFEIIALMIVTASLLPLVAEQLMVAELVSHFRVQLAVALVLTAVLLLIGKARMFLIPVVIGLVFTLTSITPLYLGSVERSTSSNFRVLSSNLNSHNKNFDAIKTIFESSNADVICIQELSWDLSDYLAENLTGYPHKFIEPRSDNFGIGIYSKHELFERETIFIKRDATDQSERGNDTNSLPTLRASIKRGATVLTIFNTHPPPPVREELLKWRNTQMDRLARMISRIPGSVILCGDLNCTPYSPYFIHWLDTAKLTDTEVGLGVLPSWPTSMPVLGVPLDHILYRGNLKLFERKFAPPSGSDHDSVIASFLIP